jgi:uncharacterized protein
LIWFLGILIFLWLGMNLIAVRIGTRPPRTPILCSPGAIGSPQEPVTIRSQDLIELSGWWVQGSHPKNVAVLSHGYLLSKGELAPVAYWLWQRGFSCLLFDFRGHGQSDPGPCTFGYQEKDDVVSALEYVKKRNPESQIVLIGSSMGSVASALAWAERPELADALVLDSAYSNLGKAVGGWWRFIGGWWLPLILWPAAPLSVLFLGFNPYAVKVHEYLESLRGRPMLFMHGANDPVVPARQAGKNLFAMGPDVPAVWFADCGHSEGRWELPDTYQAAILKFLEENGFLTPKVAECANE